MPRPEKEPQVEACVTGGPHDGGRVRNRDAARNDWPRYIYLPKRIASADFVPWVRIRGVSFTAKYQRQERQGVIVYRYVDSRA